MKEDNKKLTDRGFYVALYFMIAHLTAYVAILVLTITIGVLISTASVPLESLGGTKATLVTLALAILMLAEFYSIWRMRTLGNIVIKGLPETETQWLIFIRHPWNLSLAGLVALAFTTWDVLLVLKVI
jgi:hypothetical protein